MRKKGLAICAMAAVLTVGTVTVSAWAAEGWSQTGNSWVYYDSNGYKMTNVWKKGADGQWRYLDNSGQMAINSWVDDTFYVDANGIMMIDKWLKVQSDGRSDSGDDYKWYYFNSDGKAVSDNWKKIDNKWYYFDSDMTMQTGWVMDDMYFCGTDGVMKTGWQKLYPADADEYETNKVTPSMDDVDDDGRYWYYFSTSGKKYMPSRDDDVYKQHKIDGAYYCFGSDGRMMTGWTNMQGDVGISNTIEDFKYVGSDGKAKTGWLSLEPPESLSGSDGTVEWFYFSGNGTPKIGPVEGEATASDLVKINNITYLFNEKGNPVNGIQKIYSGKDKKSYTAYYFGDKKTSSVLKGRRKIEEGDGTQTEFYFTDSGRGYTGVNDSKLYYMGKLQQGDTGEKYSIISMPSGDSHTNYVVSSSGKIAKGTTVKNADGVKYKTGSNGVLLKIDEENPGSGVYTLPSEPIWKNE